MKRYSKSILGVTLLEIMLVLAIAAMIIVMSVRYYQSANMSESVNTTLEQVQAIGVAADTAQQATGTYSAVGTGAGSSGFVAMLPKNGLNTNWGSTISVSGSGSTYTITIGAMPGEICSALAVRLKANSHYTMGSCATVGGTGSATVTYSSQ